MILLYISRTSASVREFHIREVQNVEDKLLPKIGSVLNCVCSIGQGIIWLFHSRPTGKGARSRIRNDWSILADFHCKAPKIWPMDDSTQWVLLVSSTEWRNQCLRTTPRIRDYILQGGTSFVEAIRVGAFGDTSRKHPCMKPTTLKEGYVKRRSAFMYSE